MELIFQRKRWELGLLVNRKQNKVRLFPEVHKILDQWFQHDTAQATAKFWG